jgi:transposase-like protein
MSSTERLNTVARIWNEATECGLPRVETIRQSFPEVTPRTIQRWIREARDAGLLSEARRGNWGANEPALRATAETLGVGYEELVIALRQHFGGRRALRISASEERAARAALKEV